MLAWMMICSSGVLMGRPMPSEGELVGVLVSPELGLVARCLTSNDLGQAHFRVAPLIRRIVHQSLHRILCVVTRGSHHSFVYFDGIGAS